MNTTPMNLHLARLHRDQIASDVRQARRPRGILRRRRDDAARQVTDRTGPAGVQPARPGCSP